MRRIIFILFVVLIANLSAYQARAATSAEQRSTHISIVSEGQGTPVVLIPGLASPRHVWDGVARDLAKRHRLIRVQVNGFAGSPPPPDGSHALLDGIVGDLATYLRQQGVSDAAVIGHSMGGLVGMMLAKQNPEAVGRLMIVDALPFYGALMGPGSTPDSIRPIAEQMRSMIVDGPAPTRAPPNMSLTPNGQSKVLEWLKASDRSTVGRAMVEVATTDFTPNLPALAQTPVTVVYAVPATERAAMISGLYRRAYSGLPGATLVRVEGSAHFIMLDQPERLAQELTRFLKD